MNEYKAGTPDGLGHEPLAISARAVSVAVAILFGGILSALLLVAGLAALLAAGRGGKPSVTPPGVPVAPPPGVPPVDANQIGTLRALRAREEALLTEYAWIDRDAGVARVPIQRAMEILAQQPAPTPDLRDEDRTVE
jgi:hypothetical protein